MAESQNCLNWDWSFQEMEEMKGSEGGPQASNAYTNCPHLMNFKLWQPKDREDVALHVAIGLSDAPSDWGSFNTPQWHC